MRVTSLESKPFHSVPYLNAGPRGVAVRARLPWYHGTVDALPEGCDALVLTSDLQGRSVASSHAPPDQLLGVVIAEALSDHESTRYDSLGILLAGDLFAVSGACKRGGYGDVRPVFDAFAAIAAWTLAIAGNHDDISQCADHDVALLDGDVVSVGDVRIGGVGLVESSKIKHGRRSPEEQHTLREIVLEERCDVLLLHEGPDFETRKGHTEIREQLVKHRVGLTVFGHTAWDEPLAELAPGVQALNTHERVIILRAK